MTRCVGLSALPGPPVGGVRSCPRPAKYIVQDSDQLRPIEGACGHHLGWLVARRVASYMAVSVEAAP